MSISFGMADTARTHTRLTDNRLAPEKVLYTVYLLAEELVAIALTEDRLSVVHDDLTLGVINGLLFVNGGAVPEGVSQIDDRELFVVDAGSADTRHVLFDHDEHFILGSPDVANVRTQGDSTLVVHGDELIATPGADFLYLNERRVTRSGVLGRMAIGDRVLTPEYLLEKRPTQWRVTTFTDGVVLDSSTFLEQNRNAEVPPDFPDYRRSPRITLETPSDTIRVERSQRRRSRTRTAFSRLSFLRWGWWRSVSPQPSCRDGIR